MGVKQETAACTKVSFQSIQGGVSDGDVWLLGLRDSAYSIPVQSRYLIVCYQRSHLLKARIYHCSMDSI